MPKTAKRAPIRTVEEYFARVPEHALGPLTRMREIIRSVVPKGTTEVISYRIPAFKRDQTIVWYAAFAHHVSLFPGGSVLARFSDELDEFKTARGTVQFPLDRRLPVGLIKRIVKARIRQMER